MRGWKLSADTGGTFTDFLAEGPDGELRRGKVLSSGRLRTRIRTVDTEGTVWIEPIPIAETGWLKGKAVRIAGEGAGRIVAAGTDWLRLDGDVARAHGGDILELDSGLEAPLLAMHMHLPEVVAGAAEVAAFRLGTTKGTNALLEKKGAPVALFLTAGFADLLLIRDQKRPDLFAREILREAPLYRRVFGIAGRHDPQGRELEALDGQALKQAAREALAEGCTAAAVCFLNSWRNGAHEKEAGRILREAGFERICLSSEIRPLIKYLDRTETTLVNATLSPVMDAYLDKVAEGIDGKPLWIMTSAGGLVSRDRFHAVDSLVSGPAGGVLGAVKAGRQAGLDHIIALDMGGTSTDVSRWKARLELRPHVQVGPARLLTPALPIETVAAGGGSVCSFREGRLNVGPESAGADPGPSAYGAGGPLTLTDIHLLLGRMDPEGFSIPIRMEDARRALQELLNQSGEADWQRLAEGLLVIANERMAHAIRQVSLREGEDPSRYGLVVFGGAGGLHACRLCEMLGMERIIFPPDAGILSASGIHHAPREAVIERQILADLEDGPFDPEEELLRLLGEASDQLTHDGVEPHHREAPDYTVFIRIKGQETGIPVPWRNGCRLADSFRARFESIFGYWPDHPSLEAVKLRVRLLERSRELDTESFAGKERAPPHAEVEGFVEGQERRIPVYLREALEPGMRMEGPAILRDPFGTCFIEPGWTGVSGSLGSIELVHSGRASRGRPPTQTENVEKTLVLNRLEGLVEEMGDQLQRTALSTNIRERLDFSCALLDEAGRLLVNAPHIPVHLGAMGLCVRECVKRLNPGPGDVIITNHPAIGGSHLPDVTLLCGLFDDEGKLTGYLANRAHHAEWGGRSPGSMPADARHLAEEGVIVPPSWLIRKEKAHFDDIAKRLRESPYPSRALRENRIDLEAQLAALHRGRSLFTTLLRDYSPSRIRLYFRELYEMGRTVLTHALAERGDFTGSATTFLDDGHRIELHISSREGRLTIDFTGTDGVHPGNLNATPAIVRSAVLYALRLFVDTPMPLNEGLLDAVEIVLPECFLNPVFPPDPANCPAVVGGNVETSQRLVDALIHALGIMAAGQGTMNNFLFGNDRFGYYETIGGGAGAGDGFPGASGVHVHMTNTAITDPEILEQRFPVTCREFSLRRGSGAPGKWKGGDGLVREIRFKEPVSVSLLTQNRADGPKGLNGGGDGLAGRQFLVRKDGTREPLAGIAQLELQPGEAIRMETPGGGGWGR